MSKFVPIAPLVCENSIKKFVQNIGYAERLLVITGAGISTESGIPDYRSAGVGMYARTNHKPILDSEFMKSEERRKKFWARNYLAWPNFSSAKCNDNHYAVAKWESSERFVWLITQNVDSLHVKAGSEMLTELHGSGSCVKCTSCGYKEHREQFQTKLYELNPNFMKKYTNPGEVAPDGDVVLEPGAEKDFNLPCCPNCKGIMKTDVIFFGGFVPRTVVDHCYSKVDECDSILVIGSSLTVMSGYRFVSYAHTQGKPIFILNIGPTRADHLATMKLDYKISDVIKQI